MTADPDYLAASPAEPANATLGAGCRLIRKRCWSGAPVCRYCGRAAPASSAAMSAMERKPRS